MQRGSVQQEGGVEGGGLEGRVMRTFYFVKKAETSWARKLPKENSTIFRFPIGTECSRDWVWGTKRKGGEEVRLFMGLEKR